jgi:hypothetical protein
VSFARRNVPPPAAFYITTDDLLYIECHNSTATTFVGVVMRILMPTGEIKTFDYRLQLTAGSVFTSGTFPLTEGFLLTALAAGGDVGLQRGQLWVRVLIVRGGTANLLGAHTLIEDYLEQHYAPAWPNGTLRSPLEGRGALRSIIGTDPAAGVEISETVPTGRRWRLQTFNFVLTTDATAATRQVLLAIDDGTNVQFIVPAISTQLASLTIRYSYGPVGAPQATAIARNVSVLPVDLYLPSGSRIRTVTDAFQAGDNYAAPIYSVEEWLERPF